MLTPLQKLQAIKDKVTGQAQGGLIDDPSALIEIQHVLMTQYGWIPLKEFRELPIPTLWGLLDCIRRQQEAEKRELDKAKRRR